ncbi:hypothetical protein JCM5296_001743 [Sporobolomyces johnsonii]
MPGASTLGLGSLRLPAPFSRTPHKRNPSGLLDARDGDDKLSTRRKVKLGGQWTASKLLRWLGGVALLTVLYFWWRYQLHIEIQIFSQGWVNQAILPVRPLSSTCFNPSHIASTSYNTSLAGAPIYVDETAKAIPLLLALVSRLGDLITLWPDQMVLHALPAPAYRGLGEVRRPRALDQREPERLINQIVEWRRFELTCRSRLLTTVEDKFDEQVADWWFRFFETTIRGAPGVDSDPDQDAGSAEAAASSYWRDLVALLELGGPVLGSPQPGLSCALYASKLGKEGTASGCRSLGRVSDVLLNVHFYRQFSPRVASFLTTERSKVEKDAQNLIKLASWKDITVYALRQSAVKSHHHLYKSVRKLRAVLQKPASDLFTGPEAGLAWHLRPSVAQDHASHLEQFALEIITTAKDLCNESVGPEEGREQRVKSLIERKRRAWRDLLNGLKRIGVSPSPRGRRQCLLFGDRAAPSRTRQLGSPRRRPGSTRQGGCLPLPLLSELQTLGSDPASHNADVRTADIVRALGHIHGGVALTDDQHAQLVEATEEQNP